MYTWAADKLLFTSVTASFLYMIPQVLFSCYLIYYGTGNIVGKKPSLPINVSETLMVLFICVVTDRSLSNYSVPGLYKSPGLKTPLPEIKRVFLALAYMGAASGAMLAIKSVCYQLAAKEEKKWKAS